MLHTGLPKAVILTAVPKRLRRKVLGDWVGLEVMGACDVGSIVSFQATGSGRHLIRRSRI